MAGHEGDRVDDPRELPDHPCQAGADPATDRRDNDDQRGHDRRDRPREGIQRDLPRMPECRSDRPGEPHNERPDRAQPAADPPLDRPERSIHPTDGRQDKLAEGSNAPEGQDPETCDGGPGGPNLFANPGERVVELGRELEQERLEQQARDHQQRLDHVDRSSDRRTDPLHDADDRVPEPVEAEPQRDERREDDGERAGQAAPVAASWIGTHPAPGLDGRRRRLVFDRKPSTGTAPTLAPSLPSRGIAPGLVRVHIHMNAEGSVSLPGSGRVVARAGPPPQPDRDVAGEAAMSDPSPAGAGNRVAT